MEFHTAREVRGHAQSQSTQSKESGGSYSHNTATGRKRHREEQMKQEENVLKDYIIIFVLPFLLINH